MHCLSLKIRLLYKKSEEGDERRVDKTGSEVTGGERKQKEPGAQVQGVVDIYHGCFHR